MKLILNRLNIEANNIYGILKLPNMTELVTLEHKELRIPLGNYTCRRVTSPKFGLTYEVMNVPNRTHILFHKGNYKDDTKGCILLGTMFNRESIANSKIAFDKFMDCLENAYEFELEITFI